MNNNWNSAKIPPNDDREVVVYVRNLETPHWSRNHIGAYINGKWYLRGGTQDYYEYVRWLDISAEKELKTVEEWNKIFSKTIALEEGLITEKGYISKVIDSTIFI